MDTKDVWNSIKGIVGKIAPVLGNAIVPGAGGIAGSLISSVLGCDSDPMSIEKALINATPEQMVEIKNLENSHKEKLIELGIENDKLYVQDIQDARRREIEIVKATGKKDYNLYVLAWTVIVGFFALCGFLMVKPLPTGATEVVYMLFGALASGFGVVLQYFFGSSKSSSDKTTLMAVKKWELSSSFFSDNGTSH